MRKDLRDIKDQKDSLIAAMNRSDVALDGPGYEQALKNYKMLVEIEEIIKKGRSERGPLQVALKIGGFLVTAAGVILVPQLLAEKELVKHEKVRDEADETVEEEKEKV